MVPHPAFGVIIAGKRSGRRPGDHLSFSHHSSVLGGGFTGYSFCVFHTKYGRGRGRMTRHFCGDQMAPLPEESSGGMGGGRDTRTSAMGMVAPRVLRGRLGRYIAERARWGY